MGAGAGFLRVWQRRSKSVSLTASGAGAGFLRVRQRECCRSYEICCLEIRSTGTETCFYYILSNFCVGIVFFVRGRAGAGDKGSGSITA